MIKFALSLLACLTLTSCCCSHVVREYAEQDRKFPADMKNPTVLASRVTAPVKIDGVISPEEWKGAWTYSMANAPRPGVYLPPKRKASIEGDAFEGGSFMVKYDDKFLYFAFRMEDSDVVFLGKDNQDMLFRFGDTLEIFLKSKKRPEHWELYATPSCNKASLLQIGFGGYANNIMADFRDDMKVAATIQGTLNDYNDKDKGFCIEVAVPFKMMEDITGVKVNNAGDWTLLIGRYNFIATTDKQLSSFPAMPQQNFHLKEYYADLTFED